MEEEQERMEREESDAEDVEVETNGAESKSRRKRSSDDEDDETELESKNVRKTKGAEKKAKVGDDDNGIVCELSKNRMIAVQNFKGQLLISIREYYEKNGKLHPGHKGLSLTVEQWEALKEGVADVDAAVSRLTAE